MNQFLDKASDVAAFAKNQGPQALRVDCLSPAGVRSLYTPDFVIRREDGDYYLAETKGTGFEKDPAVAAKAKAAQEWCRAATSSQRTWRYLYVPQKVFEAFTGDSIEELASACRPALVALIRAVQTPQLAFDIGSAEASARVEEFMALDAFASLSSADRNGIEQAVQLYDFIAAKQGAILAPIFQPLLGRIDNAAEALVVTRLGPRVPESPAARDEFFAPPGKPFLAERVRTLRRLLVTRSPLMPTGLLIFCIEYARGDKSDPSPALVATQEAFADLIGSELYESLQRQYAFRNEYVAHEKREPLRSAEAAREALENWIRVLLALRRATDTPAPAHATDVSRRTRGGLLER